MLTLERVIAVKYPLKAKLYLSLFRLKCIIIVVFILTAIVNLHHVIGREVLRLPLCSNANIFTHRYRLRCDSEIIRRYYTTSLLISVALTVFIPLPIIILLNGCLLKIIAQSHRLRQNMTSQSRDSTIPYGTLVLLF